SGIRASDADQLIGMGIAQRNQQDSIHKAENRSVGTNAQSKCQYSNRGEDRRFAQCARAETYVSKEALQRRPLPHFAAFFFRQTDVAELPASRRGGFLPGHAARNQLLDFFFQVLANFFGELAVKAASQKQLLEPAHDSPLAVTFPQFPFRAPSSSFIPQRHN